MKETYKVRCPKRIVFGDPQYFEQLKGAKLKSLTVDYEPRSHFTSRVVIEEKPFERFPQRNELTLNIYFAPEDEIETYMENMMYQGQKVTVKNIGIDSPEYCLKIDEQEITMQTDGDGYWGAMHEYYRMLDGRKYQDGGKISGKEETSSILLCRYALLSNPKVKALLKKDMEFLDHIQIEMATARQFLFIARCKNMKQEQVFNMANRVEKVITEQGFEVRRMKKEDVKRFLAIYFDASMNGELMPDTDGEQFSAFIDKDSVERVK